MRFFKCTLLIFSVIFFCLVMMCNVSAQSYTDVLPSYVPYAGGAWFEVNTSQGVVTVVVPVNYIHDTFSFEGSGYNICNATSSTVQGYVYKNGRFSYFGNPSSLQCRFTALNTLEVYEPYQQNYGGTSYRWTALSITGVQNTNVDFMDETASDRQNDNYRYDTTQKILIYIFIAVCAVVLMFVIWRCWHA